MPVYEAACDCGRRADYFRTVDKRRDTPTCECGLPMRQVITPVRGFADLPAYESPIDGREIRGRRARREDLIRNNCREYEGLDVEKREAEKARKHREEQTARQVEAELGRTISDLDASNKLTRKGERSDQPYEPEGRTYG